MNEYSMTHSDADLLLPWYVNGTLGHAEKVAVQGHLESCEACQESVRLLRQVDSAVRERSPVPIVPQPRVEELLDRVDASVGKTAVKKSRNGWLIAASMAIVALAASLFYAGPRDDTGAPTLFETATSLDNDGRMGYLFEIRFEADTTIADQHRILAHFGASDVKIDESTGAHQVLLQLRAQSLEELQLYTEQLRAYAGIDSARVIAVQLPVRREQ
jgi:hypothetical protein